MKRIVQWNYNSNLGGPWGPGAIVNLDPDTIEAIDKDSPGVLVEPPHDPEPKSPSEPPVSERVIEAPPKDRQVRRSTRRSPAKPKPAAKSAKQ